jgi:hypothetical protein
VKNKARLVIKGYNKKKLGMNVIYQMELVSTYLELYNSRYEKNTE